MVVFSSGLSLCGLRVVLLPFLLPPLASSSHPSSHEAGVQGIAFPPSAATSERPVPTCSQEMLGRPHCCRTPEPGVFPLWEDPLQIKGSHGPPLHGGAQGSLQPFSVFP